MRDTVSLPTADDNPVSSGVTRSIPANKDSNRILWALVKVCPLAVVILNPRHKVVVWNTEAERIFGWPADEIVGHRLPIPTDQGPPDVDKQWDQILDSKLSASMEICCARKDGKSIDVSVCSASICDAKGNSVGRVVMFDDITERKRLEAELRHCQKLASVGILASRAVHEFNNLLMGISGFAEVLQTRTGSDHRWSSLVSDIQRCVDEAAKLTHDLLAFARRDSIGLQWIDLGRLVVEAKPLMDVLSGSNINIALDLAEGLKSVYADPVQIEQALINLVINARDAMPKGGTITLSTRLWQVDSADRADRPRMKPGQYVDLSVSDTGIGMDQETLSCIFDPFFTTKAKGTGLGLAIVRRVVKEHMGYIDVVSDLGRGTSFHIYLPVHDANALSSLGPNAA